MGPRILVVNVNWLGDVLFSTPALRALRKKFPESHIACLVPPRCGDLLVNNPYVNEVIPCEDEEGFVFTLARSLGLIAELRRKRFDTAIFFHRSKTKVFLTWLGGVRERWGFSAPRRPRLLTRAFPRPGEKLHRVDFFLNLLEQAGVPDDGRTLDFFPKKEAAAELRSLLWAYGVRDPVPYVVVHPGGNWALKRWPAERFREWISLFLKERPWKVILCGTPAEADLSRRIASHFKEEEVVSLCGKTSLDALALLLKNAQFILSNDSGPIHLAASQGTAILGLFGPTAPAVTGPISRGRVVIAKKEVTCEIPCYVKSCKNRVCMERLMPEEVFEKTKELLTAEA